MSRFFDTRLVSTCGMALSVIPPVVWHSPSFHALFALTCINQQGGGPSGVTPVVNEATPARLPNAFFFDTRLVSTRGMAPPPRHSMCFRTNVY